MSIGPGTRLGSYVVQDFIGQGAMGVVYRAYHAELERVAAVKVLQGLATDPDSNARFRREAQAIAHMRHPNVLNVFDFGEFERTPYMAPEQVSGKHVGPAADRYAFAVMAYEMLTGSFPFQEDGVLEVLYAHVHKTPPAPSTINERIGPRADAVILRGMAKDPNARWESCESFVAALTTALQSPSEGADKTVVMRPPAPAPVG